MRKLKMNEKKEAAHMLAMLMVLLRVINHLIIEAEKNAKWMQRYDVRTTRLINTLCRANGVVQKATGQLYFSIYSQIDNSQIYSIDVYDMEIEKSYTKANQYSLKMNMDFVDEEMEKLSEEAYRFITGGLDDD